MLDTNLLVNIGLSMITNFADTIGIPQDWVPRATTDVVACTVGDPIGPTSLHLVSRGGIQFWIGRGAVRGFTCPGSYFTAQDPNLLPQFLGTTTMTSRDAVQIATKALRGLAKSGDPLADGSPRVRLPTGYRGAAIPFFRVSWTN